jgi:hypothetical protein
MAIITLQPATDFSAAWVPKGGGTNAAEVQEGVSAHDDTATENTAARNDTDQLELDDTPGDFGDAIDYQISCVILQSGQVDDTVNVLTQITAVGSAVDAFQDTHDISATTSYTEFNGAVRTNTDAAAAWDGYEIEYDANLTTSGMPDEVTWAITAIEVVVNYDEAAAGGDGTDIPYPRAEEPLRFRVRVVPSGPGAGYGDN